MATKDVREGYVKIDQNVPLTQLLSIIPKFSENSKNINTFCSNCTTAYNLAIGIQKQLILPYAVSQLEGKAASFANIHNFNSLTEFLKKLKSTFTQNQYASSNPTNQT